MELLKNSIARISELDKEAMRLCKIHLDDLTKPKNSMGVLEDIAIKLSGIYGSHKLEHGKNLMIIMAGDHGIVEEGISGYPQSVTKEMVNNILHNGAGINILLNHNNDTFICVDMGINGEVIEEGLIHRKIRNGTMNISKGPAMTKQEAIKAVETGIEIACNEINKGARVLGIGEMGVGNTTASSAILKAFSGLDTDLIVDKGAGISDEALIRKRAIVEEAIRINKPNPNDAIDVLSKVGGLEIGGLAGVIIGSASMNIPVVIDGFISGAAALLAYKLAPKTRDYMIPSHQSVEVGHKWMMDIMSLKPYLDMNMRLGEGSGAAIGFSFIDMSISMLNDMATFSSAGVSKSNIELKAEGKSL